MRVLPALGESAGSGLGPAARCWPRTCAERREDAIPAALFLRNGSREPAPEPPASPPGSRGAAGRGAPTVGSFEGFPSSRPSRGGEGREGTRETRHPSSVRALQREPALRSLALLFSEPLPAPVARSQTEERKKKRGGGGAADSGALPALLWEDSSAATGGEGLRAGSGEGARCSAGSGRTSSLRGRRLHRPERRGRRVPEGRTTSGRRAEARSLISARAQLSGTLQGLWRSARNPLTCRKLGRPRCGVRGGRGQRILLWLPAAGLGCWGVRPAATKSAFTERQKSIEALGDGGGGGGVDRCLACEIALTKESIPAVAA